MNTLASQLIKKFENAEEPNGSEIVLTKIEDLLRLFDTDGDAWAALVEEVADEFEVSIEDFASLVEFARGQDEEGQQELLEIILEIADDEGYDTAKFESKQKFEAKFYDTHVEFVEANKDAKPGDQLIDPKYKTKMSHTIVLHATENKLVMKTNALGGIEVKSIDVKAKTFDVVLIPSDSIKFLK